MTRDQVLWRTAQTAKTWRHVEDVSEPSSVTGSPVIFWHRRQFVLTADERVGVEDDIDQWFDEQGGRPFTGPELDAEIEKCCLSRLEGREEDTRERGEDDGSAYSDPGSKLRGEE